VLFVEAGRQLGFGARIVSGYQFNPSPTMMQSAEAGSTQAWAEIYMPGAGWITFDPVNRSVGGFNLIPVAAVPTARRRIETQRSSVCVQQNKGGYMKIQSGILAALVIIAAIAPLQAEAKGCIKGAIVGGIAGHMAGHGKLGAAAGCVVGHHEANKPRSNQQGQPAELPK